MTGRASLCGSAFAALMGGVVKLHIEPFEKFYRKGACRRRHGVHLVMTYGAHRRFFAGVCELAQVTADAGIVPGIFELLRFRLAPVTRTAVKLLMFRHFM